MGARKRTLFVATLAALASAVGCTFPTLQFALGDGGPSMELPVDATTSDDAQDEPDAGDDDSTGISDAGPAIDAPSLPDGACDQNGTWGSEITIDVSWQPQGINQVALAAGTGQIKQWIKGDRTQTGTALSDQTSVCAILLPDFKGSVLNETYGVRFPDRLFDTAGYLHPFTVNSAVSRLTPGASFNSTTNAVLLGIDLGQPTMDPWPPFVTPAIADDMDMDGKPGVTALVAQGTGYSNIPAEFPPLFQQLPRASEVYLAIRQVTIVNATVNDCNDISGTVSIPPLPSMDGGPPKPGIDSHVLGCALEDGGDCTASEAAFLDNTQPVFTPTGATTFKSVRMKPGATCADVRAKLN
jgi:hypothetical protein